MNKSWKLTVAFAGLLLVLSAAYLLTSPPSATPIGEMQSDRVLGDLAASQISKIEIVSKDGPPLAFEQATDLVGEHWRIVGERTSVAETALVQQMLYSLDRFVKPGGLEPGKPESAPELTGVNDPRVTVTLVSAGKRHVLRFGKQPPTNSTVVCYQLEGDPKTYLVGVDTFESFHKSAAQYRAKQLVRFSPHRVNRVELERKYLRARGKDIPPATEYDRSVLERFEEGAERGWYLTSPHREKLDDHAVAGLITNIAGLNAEGYQAPGNAKAQGMDEPEAKISFFMNGEDKPARVQFGAPEERGRRRWVWVPGTGEVALMENYLFEEKHLPLERNLLRNNVIFPFAPGNVKRFEVEVQDLGKAVVERREIKKAGEEVSTFKWVVVEPADVRIEPERVEAFVNSVLQNRIVSFMGAQDFKTVGLDPAPIQVRVETAEGKKHAFGFALSTQGFLRKEGVQEIFEVRPELVRQLKRLELNFMNLEMFNVQRRDLTEFSFERRQSADLKPVYYRLKKDEGNQKWAFTDAAHKNAKVDDDAVTNLIALMNFIRAESMIGRDAKTVNEYRLLEGVAPATLSITYLKGLADLYISENQSNKPGDPIYYARFKDNPAVFKINGMFIENLQRVPELRKDSGEEKEK